MNVMVRYMLLPLLLGLVFIQCKPEESAPVEGDAEINLGDYEIAEVKGGVERAVKYGANNEVTEQGYLVNNTLSGTWISYDQNGRISKLTSYAEGKRNGPYIEFSSRGQIEYIAHYEDDMLNGKVASYRNGRKLEVARYKGGQLHGTRELYFDSGREMGKIHRTIEYKNGQIHGKMRYYNTEGEVTLEYTYENGERVGGGMKQNETGGDLE